MSNDTIATVNNLMHKGFEIPFEKLVPEANLFEDLGLDSLDAVDMLVYLEENLGVKIDSSRLMQVRKMQDLYALAADLSLKEK